MMRIDVKVRDGSVVEVKEIKFFLLMINSNRFWTGKWSRELEWH